MIRITSPIQFFCFVLKTTISKQVATKIILYQLINLQYTINFDPLMEKYQNKIHITHKTT